MANLNIKIDTKFVKMDTSKPKKKFHMIKGLPFYYDKHDSIIIATDAHEPFQTPGIYEYYLKTNQVQLLAAYGKVFCGETNHIFVDDSNNKLLHIIPSCFRNPSDKMIIFNLETNEIKYKSISALSRAPFTSLVFIPSTNEIHTIGRSYNQCNVINIKENKIVQNVPANSVKNHHDLVYIKSKQQILSLCVKDWQEEAAVWSLNIEKHPYEWKYYSHCPFAQKLTRSRVLILDNIIFVIEVVDNVSGTTLVDSYTGNIWFHDIYFDPDWFSLEYCLPLDSPVDGHCWTCIDNQNWIHFISLYYNNLFHFKAPIHKLTPKEITENRAKLYKILTMGYIREKENTKFIPSIPLVLKYLISRYVPIICHT